jgi:hypothetical protein
LSCQACFGSPITPRARRVSIRSSCAMSSSCSVADAAQRRRHRAGAAAVCAKDSATAETNGKAHSTRKHTGGAKTSRERSRQRLGTHCITARGMPPGVGGRRSAASTDSACTRAWRAARHRTTTAPPPQPPLPGPGRRVRAWWEGSFRRGRTHTRPGAGQQPPPTQGGGYSASGSPG